MVVAIEFNTFKFNTNFEENRFSILDHVNNVEECNFAVM